MVQPYHNGVPTIYILIYKANVISPRMLIVVHAPITVFKPYVFLAHAVVISNVIIAYEQNVNVQKDCILIQNVAHVI